VDETAVYPFTEDADRLLRYCKLPLHTGVGRVPHHGDPDHPLGQVFKQMGLSEQEPLDTELSATFLVPVSGNCLILLRWPGETTLGRAFGKGLTVSGDSPDGPFCLTCPRYYVRAVSRAGETPGWAVAAPVNGPATVTYGETRPVATVNGTINNFDFQHGNQHGAAHAPERPEVLRVEAGGRAVDFAWRAERPHLRRLVDAGVIASASFVTFSFAAWPGASDEELTTFAHRVASLCSYVTGQHTGIPVLSFLDAAGRVVRRTLVEVIQSKCRDDCALRVLHAEDGLPRVFRQCFDEHARMQQSDLWRRLPFLYAAIEDPPYLEQRCATLMMAVEMFIRSSLIEGGHLTPAAAEAKTLRRLIHMARGTLRWDMPGHYTDGERYRTTRNAVAHGGRLPHSAAQVRADFDKWRLFLLRRLFLQLGFDGQVASPHRGWASSSRVDEFSEEHNSF
jgi:hypothetical protein